MTLGDGMKQATLFVMDGAVKNNEIRLMLTHKLIGKKNADREVPGLAQAFAPYHNGNKELSRQRLGEAQKALLDEACAFEGVKTGKQRNADIDLLLTAKAWDNRMLAGCLELLQLELKGFKIETSLMGYADEMMATGKRMNKMGSEADDDFVKTTVMKFGEALRARGQALHDFVWQGDGHGL